MEDDYVAELPENAVVFDGQTADDDPYLKAIISQRSDGKLLWLRPCAALKGLAMAYTDGDDAIYVSREYMAHFRAQGYTVISEHDLN